MKKKLSISIVILLIIAIIVAIALSNMQSKAELIKISSEKELKELAGVSGENYNGLLATIITPLSGIAGSFSSPINRSTYSNTPFDAHTDSATSKGSYDLPKPYSSAAESSSTSSDYSTTNVQVENVDEADIVKTDGEYIYSVVDDSVYITYAKDANAMENVAKIQEPLSGVYPEDLIIQDNKLIVISGNSTKTIVKIYSLEDKANPTKIKEFQLNKDYYTSRYTNGILYVISSGTVKRSTENNLSYEEDGLEVIPEDPKAYAIKDLDTSKQTIIASYNLKDNSKINVQSYLMDVQNAYVSENNIYLVDNDYTGSYSEPKISDMFGIKGIFGLFEDTNSSSSKDNKSASTIYKFNFKEDGNLEYQTKEQIEGRTIDQFSLDEKDGNLRVAVSNSDGSRIVVLNEDMDQIGKTNNLAKGEKMYSARFMGDRAYLVTYKNTDPLYSIDLSDPEHPKAMGALKIPGYSTYLQPYDENHIIGFGFQTKENVRRNSLGRVTSTSVSIVGMKMALFDVSDINNPKMVEDEVIGDSRTNSTVLENHKALLFDKEKKLLAIPIKNYTSDLTMDADEDDDISTTINSYTSKLKSRKYNKIGYAVYSLDITNGFNFKGLITHDASDNSDNNSSSWYSYNNNYISDIRGLYIDDTLYTVSNKEIKANNLDTLAEIKEVIFE